jgi:two-component system response regulator YesN
LKILIVDDEPRHLRGMAKLVSAMRPNAEIVVAKDGAAAMEIVRADRPQIMLTDIQMPNMDGLTLLKWLENEPHRPKVVMVSAYNLFEYAQTALRHGAYDYLLKPIDTDKVEDILRRLDAQIATESKQDEVSEMLKDRLKLTSSAYQKNLLLLWLSGNLSAVEQEELEALDIVQGSGTVIFSELTIRLEEDKSLHTPALLQQLEHLGSFYGQANTFFLNSLRDDVFQAITIVRTPTPFQHRREDIRSAFTALSKEWLPVGRLVHGIGSSCFSLLEQLPQSYRSARTACMYTFHDRWQGVLFHDELLPSSKSFHLDGERLFEALQDTDPMAAIMLCRSAFHDLAGEGLTEPQLIKECASLTLMKIKSRTRDVVERNFGSVLTNTVITEIPACDSFGELLALLESQLRDLHQALRNMKQGKSEIIMDKCLSWIQEKYMEDLTLEMAAEQFAFNPSYFSTLIKSRTGKSFSDHITEARMRRAKELLRAGNLKIYDIAAQCGYRDTKYFCRVFKKQNGLSPETYKHKSLSTNRDEI